MVRKRIVAVAFWILAATGTLMVLSVLCLAIDSRVRSWRVERAIRRFETAPSLVRADRLMEQLDHGIPTPQQGERILRLLLQPGITTRTAYPVGQPAGISAELPFRLYVPHGSIQLRQGIEGEETPAKRQIPRGTNTLTTTPHFFLVHSLPPEPGIYRVNISYDCTMDLQRRRISLWERIRVYTMTRILKRTRIFARRAQRKTYRCRFTVPVEIKVTEKEMAERLDLICGDPIDKTVRESITANVLADRHGVYESLAGRRGYRGSTILAFENPPIAVAWQLSLRLADGRELPPGSVRPAGSRELPPETDGRPQRIRVRAGSGDLYVVDLGRFGIEEPGEHSGTLLLRPDPNYAYEDPAIKSVWNGTLEYPISFFVYTKTRTP